MNIPFNLFLFNHDINCFTGILQKEFPLFESDNSLFSSFSSLRKLADVTNVTDWYFKTHYTLNSDLKIVHRGDCLETNSGLENDH